MNYREYQKQDQNQLRQQQQNEVRIEGKAIATPLDLLMKKEGLLNNSGARRTI